MTPLTPGTETPAGMRDFAVALGHGFSRPELLEQALTHPSYASERRGAAHYERLEFLGDTVLNLVISELLLREFPDEREGPLAKRRAGLVCRDTLARVARRIGLGDCLRLGGGEQTAGGRGNPANLEDALEGVIGALYLDGGLEAARRFILREFAPLAKEMTAPPRDPKTALQEWAQARGFAVPEYEIRERTGPSHAPVFTVAARVTGYPEAVAEGLSRRRAERDAAEKLLARVEAGEKS